MKITSALIACSLFFVSVIAQAQTPYHIVNSKMLMNGTSNIHDWSLQSSTAIGGAVATINKSNALTALINITFTLPVESLESEKNGLAKNTYKAMNTEKYKDITFFGAKATIRGNNISVPGKLTISGVTKDVVLNATGTIAADKSIAIKGTYKLKMTEYGVTPPSIMMGAITTADEVTLIYDVILKP